MLVLEFMSTTMEGCNKDNVINDMVDSAVLKV